MEETKSSSGVVIVIDMQNDFHTAKDPVTVSTVIEELRFAGAFSEPVVILRFKGFGDLVSGVKETVKALKSQPQSQVLVVEKSINDGSGLIAQALSRAGISPPDRFRVCGVNINFCVRETVVGLAAKFPSASIEVVASGCNCELGRDFSNFPSSKNVSVVTSGQQRADSPDSSEESIGQGDKASTKAIASRSAVTFWDLLVTLVLVFFLVLAVHRPMSRKPANQQVFPLEKGKLD